MPLKDLLPGQFQRFHAFAGGPLWLITDGGVANLDGEMWRPILADLTGRVVGIDPPGRVWVVSEDAHAISAWDGSSWTVYRSEAGWLPIVLEDEWHREIGWMHSDGAGRLWLATSQDVRSFDGEGWTIFTPAEMGMGEVGPQESWATFTIEVARLTKTVWVGECDWGGPGPLGGQGVRRFDGAAWLGTDWPPASGCATGLAEDGRGHVWMTVDDRLWRYVPGSGEWTESAPPEPPAADMRFGFADALTLDPTGDPWPAMVLCGGASCYGKIVVYHVRDGTWRQVGDVMEFGGGLPHHEVIADASGTDWLFWAGGVYRLVEDLADPVSGMGTVYDAALDTLGRIWFVSLHEGRDVLWTIDVESERKGPS